MRRHRADNNAPLIVKELRQCGISVIPINGPNGTPDLLVGRAGLSLLVEIKNRQGKDVISQAQQNFAKSWGGCPLITAYTTEDILNTFKRLLAQ